MSRFIRSVTCIVPRSNGGGYKRGVMVTYAADGTSSNRGPIPVVVPKPERLALRGLAPK